MIDLLHKKVKNCNLKHFLSIYMEYGRNKLHVSSSFFVRSQFSLSGLYQSA